jgi:elongation factor G
MLRAGKTVDITVDRMGDKQTFARLRVSFTNFRTEKPVMVNNTVSAETLPALYAAAAERGLSDALQTGEFGYPMMNVQATITDAKIDPQMSIEDAFTRAAVEAYREATKDNIQLMEPIMKLRVTTPAEFLGNVIGDLTARRGVVESQDPLGAGDTFEVQATVPLRVLFDYADRVRSLSQGRAVSVMEPHSYEAAPDDVVRQMLGE